MGQTPLKQTKNRQKQQIYFTNILYKSKITGYLILIYLILVSVLYPYGIIYYAKIQNDKNKMMEYKSYNFSNLIMTSFQPFVGVTAEMEGNN
jgi:uncharacterized membrane protein